MKNQSIFYTPEIVERIRLNAKKYAYAADVQEKLIEKAKPWMDLSDNELWNMMFGNTIKRSWHVWSDGYCPSCGKDVTMQYWEFNPFMHPWKVQCPYCKDLFPKNDFQAFYLSGLDENNIFQYEKANRSLLFNTEHPDHKDPLHSHLVDDGDGVPDAKFGKKWRFIGSYLIYGQWKKVIIDGIENLADAYIVTGNLKYAHKAGILLDRIADLYPTFDFGEQGIIYEKKGVNGYVSTWHDSNIETRTMAIAYDKVFNAIRQDIELVDFLNRKSKGIGLENKKESFSDVQRNIEKRIFRDSLANRPKITFNFPITDLTILIIRTVIEWPEKKDEIEDYLWGIIQRATAVDGVTGEKGLANYSAIMINNLAEFLALYGLIDDSFLERAIGKVPNLKNTFRFFIDTWCMESYYPLTGDTGAFAEPIRNYRGVVFENSPLYDKKGIKGIGTSPSMYTLLWKLYKITRDTDYMKLMYRSNNKSVEGLPYDITSTNVEGLQEDILEIVKGEGTEIKLASVNKEQWHLAILRSGEGKYESDLWIDYDSGFTHGHKDGMNLGLYAKGLDLMPDFGYVPVQFGGWYTPKVKWYGMTAAHNTVVVDGKDEPRDVAGKTTLWSIGNKMKAIRVSAPELIEGEQFERTAVLVDINGKDCYILDVFRVVGGKDHAKFMHSHFGSIKTNGLSLKPTEDYGYDTLMRDFRVDDNPAMGWSVDWKVEDCLKLLPENSDIHLRYTDLTATAKAYTAEAWISAGGSKIKKEKWIPRIMIRRQADIEPIASTFVGIIEPYEEQSNIESIKRLDLQYGNGQAAPESEVAVEVLLKGEQKRDLIIAVETEISIPVTPLNTNKIIVQKDWKLVFNGELCLVSESIGKINRVVLSNGSLLRVNNIEIKLKRNVEVFEIVLIGDKYEIQNGNPEDLLELNILKVDSFSI